MAINLYCVGCCCAEDISVTETPPPGGKIAPFGRVKRYYHDFTVKMTTSRKTVIGRPIGYCRWTWHEYVTPSPDSTLGTLNIPPGGDREEDSGKIFPGSTKEQHDQPGLGLTLFGTPTAGQRTLRIVVTLTSAPNCPCAKNTKQITITQRLRGTGGQPDSGYESLSWQTE